jgi:cyanate permease
MGPIPAEIFAGKHTGAIFGTVMLAAILGGAVGPWLAGFLHDITGNYAAAFWIAIGCNAVSAAAIWRAAPGQIRAVAGRVHRIAAAHSSSS